MKSRYYDGPGPMDADAQRIAAPMFELYVKHFGRAVEGDRSCLCLLTHRRHSERYGTCRRQFPGHTDFLDHATRFILDGKTTAIVGQPYGPIDASELAKLAQWCDAQGIRLQVTARSWHYPSETIALIFTRKAPDLIPTT
jgi:hypothetical protein